MPKTIRYVELVRVSGSSQAAKDTPADQRGALDQLRKERPGKLVERIEEGAAGLSGALPLEERPDLLRLLVLAKARAFDEVRIRHLDRLTRHPDPRERWAVYGAVMDAGAVIVTCDGQVIDPTSEVGELSFAFQGMMAAKERRRILERTVTARRRLAKEGKLQGRPPWARTWDKATAKWGTVPPLVRAYRDIFARVIRGESLHSIARYLDSARVPTPGVALRGKKRSTGWSAGIVGHLVRHRSAIGEVTSYGHAIECPPIVDEANFESAQNAIKWSRAGRPPLDEGSALLRKLATCGTCGAPIWVVTGGRKGDIRLYYVCRWWRTSRVKECRKHHPVDMTDTRAKLAFEMWLREGEAGVATEKADPKAVDVAERRVKELAEEERRLLRAARTASPESIEQVLAELARDREAAMRALERARAAADRVVEVDEHEMRARAMRVMARASTVQLRRFFIEHGVRFVVKERKVQLSGL